MASCRLTATQNGRDNRYHAVTNTWPEHLHTLRFANLGVGKGQARIMKTLTTCGHQRLTFDVKSKNGLQHALAYSTVSSRKYEG